jgi:hypothetical protein
MTDVDGAAAEPTRGTAADYMEFLRWAEKKGQLPTSTVQNWRSASIKVLEIEDDWQDVNVAEFDLDEHLERFGILRRTAYTTGSMSAYKSRAKVGIETYRAWLSGALDWKPKGSGATRQSNKARSGGAASPTPAASAGVTMAPKADHGGYVPTRIPLIEYQLALRPGVRALLTLPEILTEKEAQRVVRFVEGLAVAEEQQIAEQLMITGAEASAE